MKKGTVPYPNIFTRTNIFSSKRISASKNVTSSHKYNGMYFKYEGKELNISTDFMLIGLISKLYYSNKDKSKNKTHIVLSKEIICEYFDIKPKNYNHLKVSQMLASIDRLDSSRIIIDNEKVYASYSLITAYSYNKESKDFSIYLSKFSEVKASGTFIDLLDLRFFSKNNSSYLDITYLNLDDISKLKSNPTASAIFADLSTHNFKKGFSFDRLKAKSNSTNVSNPEAKRRIIKALDFIKEKELILDYEITKNYSDSEWLKIIPNNNVCEKTHANLINNFLLNNGSNDALSFSEISTVIEQDFNFNETEVKSFITKALRYLKKQSIIKSYSIESNLDSEDWLFVEGYNYISLDNKTNNSKVQKTKRKEKVINPIVKTPNKNPVKNTKPKKVAAKIINSNLSDYM